MARRKRSKSKLPLIGLIAAGILLLASVGYSGCQVAKAACATRLAPVGAPPQFTNYVCYGEIPPGQ